MPAVMLHPILRPALTTLGPDEAERRKNWPRALQDEFERDKNNGVVGSVLVSETEVLRVWHLSIPRGKRCPFHRHVLNYLWTAHNAGKARGYFHDGRIVDVTHYQGETKHFEFGPGEYMVHSVENIGDTDLLFTTVEFLNSSAPIAVPDSLRLQAPH